ncbi:hypothetical protein GCK72_003544 [Caenorhabditis remanei]|uniref:INTS8 TPR repeats domain-containing protein n=1 Tax=Caenorhabditis remanei TaxID=31234 RepID=A0A6A5HYD2_CAERE|nr:hypothetical protein GCK72_003544 [Caenorhabditis remanei]KAF1771717.1 hypothetical protein GCK72_003544 [Caenorhabditis remanei]
MDNPDSTGEPSWLELFIDPAGISAALLDPEKKKHLPRLLIQFTDKAFFAEREKDKGKLAIEELMLFERKSASMRLCAMATFAALNYDIDYILDNITRNELQTLRVLADSFYRIYTDKNLDASFGNWLFYRLVLSIDRRNRLTPPQPRATIASTLSNGQLMPTDPALLRHEKTQRTVQELREHVLKARAFVTEMSEAAKDLIAPGPQCFLKPFVELAPKAMTAAFIGDRDVLIESPSVDFEAEKILIPAADVANKCLSELVTFLFTSGELPEARKHLHRIVRPKCPYPMVAIDEEVFRSYCQILNVQGTPYSVTPNTIRPFVYDLNTLNDESMRKSELYRYRGAQETTGQLQSVYRAENAALSVVDGHTECIRDAVKTTAELERFAKILKKRMDLLTDKRRRQIIRAHLQYLCGSIPDLRDILKTNGVDVSELRTLAVPSEHRPLERPPRLEQLANLLRGSDPFWSLMTIFDVNALKQALIELGPFWFPTKMHISEFLIESLEKRVNTPAYTLQRLLLAKLYQLSRMHNFQGFVENLSAYSVELGQDMNIDLTFESIHVKAMIGNERMPWEIEYFEATTQETSLIFNPEHIRTTDGSARMINQCLSLMLNLGDHQVVFEKGGQIPIEIFKCVPIARMFGAFVKSYDELVTQKKCADGFWRTMTPKFVDSQPTRGLRRGHDAEMRIQAARKELVLLFHMFSLLREKRLVDFIIAYAVCLHNKLMLAQKSSHLKIHARLLSIYSPDTNSKLDITNLDDVRQLLQLMIERAYSISNTDPDTIRTYADFLYVEKDYQGAAQKYLEYFAANDPTFRLSTSSDVFDDTIINRLRICTAHSGFLTMSLLTCQWLQMGRKNAYQKAIQLLKNNETRDVGANCAEFVTDVTAVELLSQHYQQNRMTKSLNTLYAGASSLSANQNVPGVLTKEEQKRRTCKLLTSLSSIYFGLHV